MMRDSFRVALDAVPVLADLPGGDLFWWREDGHWHTHITIDGDIQGNNQLPPGSLEKVRLLLVWFDAEGSPLDAQAIALRRKQSLFLDSRRLAQTFGRTILAAHDGVLAICLWPTEALPLEARSAYARLFSLLDWHSEAGDLISLHSDQSFLAADHPCEFTEIVVRETADVRNTLVIVNGPLAQAAGSVTLRIANPAGATRTASHAPDMAPFSLHRIALASLFPDLVAFGAGDCITVGGDFDSRGIYTRPYVITEGAQRGGYHGGDRYQWRSLPAFAYRLLGRGEVNPMFAIHNGELSTTVNLLNSHADLEADYWVDARLYAEDGRLVATRERWLLACRQGLSRGDIADLLPDPSQAFTGYLALNFSAHDGAFYPRHLQALMEYRSAFGAARVMAWSDHWNARERIAELVGKLDRRITEPLWSADALPHPGRVFSGYYRVWHGGSIASWIAISNPGTTPDYVRTVDYRLHLESARGERQSMDGKLAAHATAFGPLEQFFPDAAALLGEDGVGMLRIESEADLASIQLARHRRSGAWSAEHFMAGGSWFEGRYHIASGA